MMGSSGGGVAQEGESGGMGSGGMSSGGMGGDGVSASDPADNRYISFAAESLFQPRKGAELRESIKNVPTASNAIDAVAKRVSIQMRLKVDPANLSRLITECGNAGNKGLLMEVYQVRVGTDAAPATGAGGGGGGSGFGGGSKGAMGSSMGGSSSAGMMSGGFEGEGGSSGGAAGGAGPAASEDSAAEITIEIFGLIYLYNPENIATITNELTAEKTELVPAPATSTPVAQDPKTETPASDPTPASPAAPAVEPNTVEPNTVEPNTVEPSLVQPAAPVTPEPEGAVPANPVNNQ